MEKIPTPPYLEYANKYKIMGLKELEKSKYDLGTKLRYAEEKWAVFREFREQGERDVEYQAWLEIRFLMAELGVLESCLRMQSLFYIYDKKDV